MPFEPGIRAQTTTTTFSSSLETDTDFTYGTAREIQVTATWAEATKISGEIVFQIPKSLVSGIGDITSSDFTVTDTGSEYELYYDSGPLAPGNSLSPRFSITSAVKDGANYTYTIDSSVAMSADTPDGLQSTSLDKSYTVTLAPADTPLAAPTVTSVQQTEAGTIGIDWTDNSPDTTDGFIITRSLDGVDGSYSELVNSLNNTFSTYEDTESEFGQTHCYIVRTITTEGQQAGSEPVCVETEVVLTPVQLEIGSTNSDGSNTLSWERGLTDDGQDVVYNLHRSSINQTVFSQINDVPLTFDESEVVSYTDTTTTPGVDYCYRVETYNNDTGKSIFSNVLCVTRAEPFDGDGSTDESVESDLFWGPVTNLRAWYNPTSTKVVFEWDFPHSDHDGFEIHDAAVDEAVSLITTVDPNVRMYTVFDAQLGTSYCLSVIPRQGDVTPEENEVVCVEPKLASEIEQEDLFAHYSMDAATYAGHNLLDSGPQRNHATASYSLDPAVARSGIVNESLLFFHDGFYVDVPDMCESPTFSFAAFLKPGWPYSTWEPTEPQTLFRVGNSTHVYLEPIPDSQADGNQKFRIGFKSFGSTVETDQFLYSGVPYHVAAVADQNVVGLYINGEMVEEISRGDTESDSGVTCTPASTTLGGESETDTPNWADAAYVGYLDEAYVYTKALSNTEVFNLAEPLLAQDNVPGCVDPDAENYNPNATLDTGGCVYDNGSDDTVPGCTNPEAINYDPDATQDDGSCVTGEVAGLDFYTGGWEGEGGMRVTAFGDGSFTYEYNGGDCYGSLTPIDTGMFIGTNLNEDCPAIAQIELEPVSDISLTYNLVEVTQGMPLPQTDTLYRLSQCTDRVDNDGDGEIDMEDNSCQVGHTFEVAYELERLQTQAHANLDEYMSYIEELETARNYYITDARDELIGLIVGWVIAEAFSKDVTKAMQSTFAKYYGDEITDKIVAEYSDILVDQLPDVREAMLDALLAKKGAKLTNALIIEIMGTTATELNIEAQDRITEKTQTLYRYIHDESLVTHEQERVNEVKAEVDVLVNEIYQRYGEGNIDRSVEEYFSGDLQRRLSGNLAALSYIATRAKTLDTYAELDGSQQLFWTRMIGSVGGIGLSVMMPGISPVILTASKVGEVEKVALDLILWQMADNFLREGGVKNGNGSFTSDVGGSMQQNVLDGLNRVLTSTNNGLFAKGQFAELEKITKNGNWYIRTSIENTGAERAEYKLVVGTQLNIPLKYISWLPAYQWRLPVTNTYTSGGTWFTLDPDEVMSFDIPIPDDVWRWVETDDTITLSLLGRTEEEMRLLQQQSVLGQDVDVANRQILAAKINSPGDLRVVDASGNITGVVDGQIVQDIPDSYYDPFQHGVVVFNPGEGYEFIVDGTATGTYGLTLERGDTSDKSLVEVVDVPTIKGHLHSYAVNWQQLDDAQGVEMRIDIDADGIPEVTNEVGSQVGDVQAPVSRLNGDCLDGFSNYAQTCDFSIVARDEYSGVKSIEYSFDTETWQEYTGTSTVSEEGEYIIYYRSIDWFGNVEEIKTANFEIVSAQGLREQALEKLQYLETENRVTEEDIAQLVRTLQQTLDEQYWSDRNTMVYPGRAVPGLDRGLLRRLERMIEGQGAYARMPISESIRTELTKVQTDIELAQEIASVAPQATVRSRSSGGSSSGGTRVLSRQAPEEQVAGVQTTSRLFLLQELVRALTAYRDLLLSLTGR